MKALTLFLLLSLVLLLGTASSDIDLDGSNSNQKWVTIKGAPIGSYSGKVVSNIGDFNGDGIDDMVINAPNGPFSEVAYVIYGKKDGYLQDTIHVDSTFSEGFTIHGPFINSEFTNFGYSVSKAIDLDGDGLSDIVLGAYAFSNYQGEVYVIYGKKGHSGDITINQDYTFSSAEGFVIFGTQSSQLGYSVGSAGDFNGDGFEDLLVGAPGYQSSEGAVYVIYGKNGKYTNNIYLNMTQAGFTISNPAGSYCHLGAAVDGVGDINGDGLDDILAGDSSCYNVYGLYGKKSRADTTMTVDSGLDASKGFVISSSAYAGQFGSILSSAGDFNNDGIQDIILGTSTKGAFLFYGQKGNWPSFDLDGDLTSYQGFRIKDSRVGVTTPFGLAASGGGDFNGDGIDDIFVRGVYVAVIYGSKIMFAGDFDTSKDLDIEKGFTVSSSALTWKLPYVPIANSVTAGDFNNDKIDDLIIGAPNSEIFAGKAYIVFGSCPIGTFLSGGTCQECPEGCTECTSNLECQACADGYSLSDSKSCISEDEITTSKSQETQTAVSTGLFDGASAITNTLAIGSSVPTNFGLVAKILRNTRYLDIVVSKDLQGTFKSWKISTGIFPAPEDSSDSKGSLPWVFGRYEMKSAFLHNYWKSFTIILLGLVFFIMSKGAEMTFLKNNSKIPRTINVMASNFVLTQFYGSIDDILFYFVIDVRSGESASSGFRIFGFIFGLLLMLTGFVVTGLHGMILFRYQRAKKQGGSAQEVDLLAKFLKKYENIKLFFQDFKDIEVFQQAFLLINIARSLLSSFIFTLLFHYALLQVLLLIALNILILVYLYKKKPFKDKANAYAQYFCEGVLLIAYLSILVLAIMDAAESKASKAIESFSMIVIISNMMLLMGSAVFMSVNIAAILYEIYKERRSKKSTDGISIPTIRSRLDSRDKIDLKISDTIDKGFFQPNALADNSNTLNTSGLNLFPNDSFQGSQETTSPKLGHRRKIRRETVFRSTQSPIFKPSIFDVPDTSIYPSPFLIHIPEDLQLEHADPSSSPSSFRLNPEGIQEEEAVPEQESEIAQFEIKTRKRGSSLPMNSLQGVATRERGLSVVMEGEEILFDSKKKRLKKIRR